jgi:hypothetical protein
LEQEEEGLAHDALEILVAKLDAALAEPLGHDDAVRGLEVPVMDRYLDSRAPTRVIVTSAMTRFRRSSSHLRGATHPFGFSLAGTLTLVRQSALCSHGGCCPRGLRPPVPA